MKTNKKKITKGRLLITNGDYILVLQKLDGKLSIPGGVVKKSESMILGLLREVKEETNLDLQSENISFLGVKINYKKHHTIYKYYYATSNVCKDKVNNNEDFKFKSLQWRLWLDTIDHLDAEDRASVLKYYSLKMPIN